MAKKKNEEIGYYFANIHTGIAAQYRYWTAEDIQEQIRHLRAYRLTWAEIADHFYPSITDGARKVESLAGTLPRRLSFLTEGITIGFEGSHSTYRNHAESKQRRFFSESS